MHVIGNAISFIHLNNNYFGAPFKSELAACYKGDLIDIDGLTYLKDYSGNDYNALAKDSTLYLNGDDNKVEFEDAITPSNSNFTLIAEIVTPIGVPYGKSFPVLSNAENNKVNGLLLTYNSTNGLQFIHKYGGSIDWQELPNSFTAGAKNKVAISVDRSGYARIYLNDEEIVTQAVDISSNSGNAITYDRVLKLGTGDLIGETDYYANIQFNNIAIYDSALTAVEISNVFTTQESTDGLILRCAFNEGGGNIVYDISGNGHNGTISGTKDGDITGTYYSLSKYSSFWNYRHGYDKWLDTGITFGDVNDNLSGVTEAVGICKKGTKYLVLDRDAITINEFDDVSELLNPSSTTIIHDLSSQFSIVFDITTDGTSVYITGVNTVGTQYIVSIYDNSFIFSSSFNVENSSTGIEYLDGSLFVSKGVRLGTMYKYSVTGVYENTFDIQINDTHVDTLSGLLFTYNGKLWCTSIVTYIATELDQSTMIATGNTLFFYNFENNFRGYGAVVTGTDEFALVGAYDYGIGNSVTLLQVGGNENVLIPYKADKTPLYTQGDVLSGMLWYETHNSGIFINNSTTIFNFPLEDSLIAADKIISDILGDGYLFNAAGDAQKDIAIADANLDVYDDTTQFHIIFSNNTVDYEWKNILIYSRVLTLEEYVKVYKYLKDAPITSNLTDNDGVDITDNDGANIKIYTKEQ